MNEILDISALNIVSKNSNDFSFAQTALSNINNIYFAQQFSNSQSNAQDSMLAVLSAIGDKLGSKVYEELLNYIDNIGNVDICKVQALQNMTKILGISYTSFNIIENMPSEIQNIIDLMSISPEYLLMSSKVNAKLAELVSAECSAAASSYTQESAEYDLSGVENPTLDNYLSSQLLDKLAYNMYCTQISASLLSTYYDFYEDGSPILSSAVITNNDDSRPAYKTYKNYKNNYHQILVKTDDYVDKIGRIKKFYNLPFFDEVKAADQIEVGEKLISDFTTYQQQILDVEFEWRKVAYNAGNPLTRNAWYRAQKVQQYIDFVESMYTIKSLSNLNLYDIDTDYVLLSKTQSAELLKGQEDIDYPMIDEAAQQLMTMTKYIRELRHKIKTQAQKNCMKGTFLFLSYVINEYLKDSIIANPTAFPNISNDVDSLKTDTQLVEYIDPTNYFNISTIVDNGSVQYKDALSNQLNPRYWESDGTIQAVIPPDNTNIFAGVNTVQSNNTAFAISQLSVFYIDMLKNRFGETSSYNNADVQTSHLGTFLNTIFDSAADTTFMSADGNLCCYYDYTEYNKQYEAITSQIDELSVNAINSISAKYDEISSQISNLQISAYNDISNLVASLSADIFQMMLSTQQSIIDISNATFGSIEQDAAESVILSAQQYVDALSIAKYSELDAKEKYYAALSTEYAIDKLSAMNSSINELSDNYFAFEANQIKSVEDKKKELLDNLNSSLSSSVDGIMDYKKELFYRYSGLSSEELPYYYYSNTIHPSYQIHPYLSSFIEMFDYSYVIENMPILAENTMFELLRGKIDSYIDDCGYLISVWSNPLNRNSDYLTQYEKVSHLDSQNKENKLFGYDGLFYPEAVYDLVTNVQEGNRSSIDSFVNKWYAGLNVSDKQKERIADQISCFYGLIKQAAIGSWYDIYRYSRDIFGNMYILLKDYQLASISSDQMQNMFEEVKRSTPGSLWIRLKNHPIAFPAYYLEEKNDGKLQYNSLQQLDYDVDRSNTVLFGTAYGIPTADQIEKISCDAILSNRNIPIVYDYFMAQDRQQIAIHAAIEDNDACKECIVINNVVQEYDYNIDVDRYKLYLTTVKQKNDPKFECDIIASNEHFVEFMNYDYSIGYISMLSSQSNEENIDVAVKQRVFFDVNVQNQGYDNISAQLIQNFNGSMTDIEADVCNGKMYLAYLSTLPADVSVDCTFTNQISGIQYNELSSMDIDVFDKALVVVQADIGKYNIYPNSTKYYLPFTDMGFLPVMQENRISAGYDDEGQLDNTIKYANMTESAFKLMEKYHIVKMQPVAESIPEEDGIQWIYGLAFPRIYEDFKNEASAITAYNPRYASSSGLSGLYVYKYNDIHMFEGSLQATDRYLVEPYQVKNYLNTLSNNENLEVKVDEDFNNISSINASQYLKSTIPWLISCDKLPDNIRAPGSQQLPIPSSLSNQAAFYLVHEQSRTAHPLSVAYVKLQDGTIKLDFNSKYYYNQINSSLSNFYNYQHTFLNLDYPGAAGYLKVYNDIISAATSPEDFNKVQYLANTYYIKNISDNKPKFLLSAEYYGEPVYYIDLLESDVSGSSVVVADTTYITPLVVAKLSNDNGLSTELSVINAAGSMYEFGLTTNQNEAQSESDI